jgi:two-component system, OmpR family, copper resistance phosphate regulon response regulator CusR
MPSILVVEDDPKTGAAVADGLRLQGYEVTLAANAAEGTRALQSTAVEAIVLDWMLPDQSGLEMLAALRARGQRLPVLLLTARDTVEDRVLGLDRGADDYLVKPFALAELSARIRALLRRAEARDTNVLVIADLMLDLNQRIARRASKEIALTPREFDVLHCLMRHAAQVVTREMLAAAVWRDVPRATPLDNVIDVHLAHLRRKIDEGHASKLLKTIRGVGFVIGAPR